ncbi:MAG: lysophospholipase [Spirochaetales bacterium]|nr:lysophospholipase [Spirochaetales bacterium]
MMNHAEGRLRGCRDYSLYFQEWIPEATVKGSVQIVHGLAEHSGRYGHVVETLVPAGFAVYAADLFGHGKSDGPRGYVETFRDFIEDERLLLNHFRAMHPPLSDKPRFMLGHSLGSIIAVHYENAYPGDFNGLVLSAFGTYSGSRVNAFMKKVLQVLSSMLPAVKIDPKLDHPNLSRDKNEMDHYYKDPHVFVDAITLRLGAEIVKNQEAVREIVKKLTLPVLIQVGSEDTIMLGHGEFGDIFTMKDRTIREYEGLKHEVYHELAGDRKTALADLLAWLESHSRTSA